MLEVAVSGESLKVLARRGSATVEADDRTVEIAEGKELDASMAPPSGQNRSRAPFRNHFATWVLIAATAPGVTGLALGIVAVSRPNPADCKFVSRSPASIRRVLSRIAGTFRRLFHDEDAQQATSRTAETTNFVSLE